MICRHTLRSVLALAVCFLVAGNASAQWVDFANETSIRLSATSSLGSNDVQEKDYAWDDIDQDGDIDLISVRKSPFTSAGRFPNVLFMNEGGVLVDRTAQYASASNVAGSQGFLDLTNDRDVAIVDLDGDGWKDVVTATTLSGSFGKYISHPRVYINRGNDGAGAWL
ncbi:MAG: VCBS repeat-containing protein, partial [Planctomycetes bacterium]|nr:VCBS repeat-containing protein [Planctomycetota bacterium]